MINRNVLWAATLALILTAAVARAADGVAPATDATAPVASQPLPVFPLKSELLKQIDDDYKTVGDNFDRVRKEMELDLGPIEDVLSALVASPQEHLLKNVNPALTFDMLMREPEKYRGEVVKMVGVLAAVKECEISLNASGITKMWKGQTCGVSGNIVTFRSLEPLPENVKPGDSVQLVGIFMQRFSYLNREPGARLTWTPLIFVRRVELFTEPTQTGVFGNSLNNIVTVGVFLGVCIFVSIFLISRAKRPVANRVMPKVKGRE